MRKSLAIKINFTLNMYFPRVPPKLLKPGQVLDVGTRAEATFTSGFAIFSMVVGSSPAWGKCFFSFSFFFLHKEKPDNQTKPSIIPPRVFEDSGISFFSRFRRDRQIIAAPQRLFLIYFSPTRHENDFPAQVFPL